MEFLRNRNLLQCSLLFLCLSFILVRTPPQVKIFFFLAAAFVMLLILCAKFVKFYRKTILQPLCLLVTVLLASGVSYGYHDVYLHKLYTLIDGEEHQITAAINKVKSSLPYASSYDVSVSCVDGVPRHFKAVLELEYPTDFEREDMITLSVTFADFEEQVNHFPEKQYNLSKGYTLKGLSDKDDAQSAGVRRSVSSFFSRVSSRLAALYEQNLTEASVGLVKCVFLADSQDLADSAERDFRKLGLSHLLAVSGMHISILLGGLYLLLSALSLHKSLKNALVMTAAVCFMFLTGFTPSATRAALMLILSYLCYYTGSRSDPLSALCFSVALICLFSPPSINDIGLQLSFSATFGILLTGPLMNTNLKGRHIPGPLRYLFTSLFVSAAAISFMLPFLLSAFSSFTFVSIFTTLLFTPLLSGVLYLCVFSLLFCKIPLLSGLLFFLLDKAAGFMLAAVQWGAGLGNFQISLAYPFVKWLGAGFVILLAVLVIRSPKKAVWYLAPLIAFAIALTGGAAIDSVGKKEQTALIACTRLQNDVLSVTHHTKTTVIDITDGTYTSLNNALAIIEKKEYITAFDHYIFANISQKSSATLRKMLNRYDFYTIYLPAAGQDTQDLHDQLAKTAEQAGCAVYDYRYGEPFTLSDVTYTIESPSFIKRSVRAVHQITIRSGEKTAAYLGAAYQETDSQPPKADIVIAGCYGPLYKSAFSYSAPQVFAGGAAAEYYSADNLTVYDEACRFILNDD